ncbi:TPA: hypothetical protein TY413_000054 [Streptococcus suis]|nr:hypothetical protein [Streptococcus suis]
MGFSEGEFAEAVLDLLGIVNYSGDDDKVVELGYVPIWWFSHLVFYST